MLKLTRTVQIPTTVFNTDNFRVGEVYTIITYTSDKYITSGLEKVTDTELTFENGVTITAEEIYNGDCQLAPAETFLDRWVAIYDIAGTSGLGSSFFVAYDEEDALGIAQDAARVNPKLNGGVVISLIRLSDFMDNFGYMPHQSVQNLAHKQVKGRTLYVSE